MSRIPSIQALKALESFSRNKTVWQTAEELNLTRSAISHQLRGLEADLPFTLLNRVGTQVELSPRACAMPKMSGPRCAFWSVRRREMPMMT